MRYRILIIILLVGSFFLKGIYFNDTKYINEIKEEVIEKEDIVFASIDINENEKKILQQIYKYMKDKDFDEAAKFIIEKEKELDLFYTKTLLEEEHYFDGENLYLTNLLPNKEYLVIGDISTFYLGYIVNMKENGYGVKINAYKADYERYSYAVGIWKDGKLNGDGETGNIVLDILSNKQINRFVLFGYFIEDALDGEVVLEIMEDDELFTYKFNVTLGIINMDENLKKDKFSDAYLISGIEDKDRKFFIKENELFDKRWINKVEF